MATALPSELLASIGSLLSSSGAGTRPGSSSGEQHTRLFEAALSIVQAAIAQASSAGSPHAMPSAGPSDPGTASGASGGNTPPGASGSNAPPGAPADPAGAPFTLATASSGAPSGTAPPSAAAPPAASPPNANTVANGTSPVASTASAGSGPNTTTITDTSNHDEKIGQFLNGGSTTTPQSEINLKPGQSGTLKYQNGQGGFDQEADSSGKYQSGASRLEFYADQNGKNNDDVSYIDGRNASISVSDGKGQTAGDTKSIAANAPAGTITKDAAGNSTIQGWYDGSTGAMKSGGAYMQGKLGTGGAYLHPKDDEKKGPGTNPMTMAGDKSQHYTAAIGNP